MYKIELGNGEEIIVSKEHKVYGSFDISNLFSYNVINLPLKSSSLISLSNLENDSNNDSGLFCGVLNQTTENIFSFGNFEESVKCLSFDMSTLFSNLENSASVPLESSFGLNTTSSPFYLRNFNNSFFTFSSNKNFILYGNQSEFFLSELSSKLQSCFNMLFFEGNEKIVQNFFNRSSSFKQFKNLPDHYPSSIKCRSTSTNFSICNNILINFSSHCKFCNNLDYLNISIGNGSIDSFSLQKITEVYFLLQQGNEVYFLNSRNEPVKIKSIEKINNYSGKIYDVDVKNDIVLVRHGFKVDENIGNLQNKGSEDLIVDGKGSGLSDLRDIDKGKDRGDDDYIAVWSRNSNNGNCSGMAAGSYNNSFSFKAVSAGQSH